MVEKRWFPVLNAINTQRQYSNRFERFIVAYFSVSVHASIHWCFRTGEKERERENTGDCKGYCLHRECDANIIHIFYLLLVTFCVYCTYRETPCSVHKPLCIAMPHSMWILYEKPNVLAINENRTHKSYRKHSKQTIEFKALFHQPDAAFWSNMIWIERFRSALSPISINVNVARDGCVCMLP